MSPQMRFVVTRPGSARPPLPLWSRRALPREFCIPKHGAAQPPLRGHPDESRSFCPCPDSQADRREKAGFSPSDTHTGREPSFTAPSGLPHHTSILQTSSIRVLTQTLLPLVHGLHLELFGFLLLFFQGNSPTDLSYLNFSWNRMKTFL